MTIVPEWWFLLPTEVRGLITGAILICMMRLGFYLLCKLDRTSIKTLQDSIDAQTIPNSMRAYEAMLLALAALSLAIRVYLRMGE